MRTDPSHFPDASLSPERLIQECLALEAAGQAKGAIERLYAACRFSPAHIGLHETLAQVLQRDNKNHEALGLLATLVKLEPNNHERHTNLATLCYALGQLPEAERHARQAMALNPLNAQAHNLLGMIHLDTHHPEEAEFHFRQLLLIHEPLAPVTANLANALNSMGKLDEAETFFRHTLELDPNNIEGCLAWARMEEARRNLPQAWSLLARAKAIDANHPGVAITHSVLLRREKRHEEALAVLDKAGTRRSPAFHFERGEVLDRKNRHDEAFAAFCMANRAIIESRKFCYLPDNHRNQANALISFFTRRRMADLSAQIPAYSPPKDTPSPIFIVGFPRSGTTMTEQILASHPNISAGDELDYLNRLTTLAPHLCDSDLAYPKCLESLGNPEKSKRIAKFRDYYLCNAELRRIIEKGKQRFTDKMPLNEQHLGLIYLMFPSAPIIHLIRHPLDVVLSTFFTDLTHGGFCAYQLETAAQHYALMFDLVEHYRREINLNYLAVRYEDMVRDPESHVGLLLDFVGEPYDPRCVDFHKNMRYARTASYAQVSEKLYTRSIFRYRNYLKYLEPVLPVLAPAIERLGYRIEPAL